MFHYRESLFKNSCFNPMCLFHVTMHCSIIPALLVGLVWSSVGHSLRNGADDTNGERGKGWRHQESLTPLQSTQCIIIPYV